MCARRGTLTAVTSQDEDGAEERGEARGGEARRGEEYLT
jgi:hypothetical protein